MADYFELKIKINPEIAEILSEICFENLECEGVVLAEEEYKDDLVLVSTTEETLKVYLTVNDDSFSLPSPLEGEGIFQREERAFEKLGEGLCRTIREILSEQRSVLLSRGLTEADLGSWEFEINKIENQDWSEKWKENWDVTHVLDNLAVVPKWIEYSPKEGEIVILMEPGSAFGTGTHPTTQVCMVATEKYMKQGAKVADIGSGSGILSVCAAKFGAQSVYGCDNDEQVIEIARENAKMNWVFDKCLFEFNTADKINDKFDFINANILHNVIADIMGDLKALMNDNAVLVLSGILEEKKQIVLDAVKKHQLRLVEEIPQDIWVGLVVTN